MCRWGMGTLLWQLLELCRQSHPALRGLFAAENTSRRERQDWNPVPCPVCVSQRAQTQVETLEKPRFGILALGEGGARLSHWDLVAFSHEKKIFINVAGGGLGGCKCRFSKSSILCFSCWISFLGKMEPSESLAAWQSADQHVHIQEDRKERVKLIVGPPWWEQNYFMKVYPETGRISSQSEGKVRKITFGGVFQMRG